MVGRYKPYPEYFDSGVEWLGKLPSHWEAKRLGSYFEERREKASDKDYEPLSVTMQGIVPQLENAAKTDAGDNRKLVLKNDFVINSRSDRKGSSGVSSLEGSVSLISTVLIPRNIQPIFAHHLLRSRSFQEEYYRYGKGIVADLWSTNYSEMKNILIPGLPKDEQLKIANFLDHETAKIDTLIEKQQLLIQLLKEKRQAVISHAVTKGLNPNAKMRDAGVEWLGEVPAHWEVSRVKFNCSVKGRIGFRGYTVEDLVDKENGALVLGASEMTLSGDILLDGCPSISWKKYYESPEIMLESGMLLFVQRGSTVGKVAYVSEGLGPATINPSLIVLRDVVIRPKFLMYCLMSSSTQTLVKAQTSATAIPMISQEQVGNYWQCIPSVEEQVKIENYIHEQLEKLDLAISTALKSIELASERRTALISAAVTGKIDVRDWIAPQASPAHREVAA